MISFRALFRGVNAKILLIVSAAILGSITLFFFGVFYIEALLLIWNLAFVLSVIVYERQRRELALTRGGEPSFSNDERWSRIKRDIERVDGKLGKTRDGEKRRYLLHEKHSLENELRRVEWSLKESNLNGMYNASTGSLRKIDPSRMPSGGGVKETPDEDEEEIEAADRYTPEGALRQRRKLERQAEERKSLERIIESAEAILKSEPPDSVPTALISVANEFRAHYNVLKKRNRRDSLADYWVAWAVISSIMNGVKIDQKITKYSSDGFRQKILKLIKLAASLKPLNEPLSMAPARSPLAGVEPEGISLDESPADLAREDEEQGP